MNEDVFPIKMVDFPACHVSFQEGRSRFCARNSQRKKGKGVLVTNYKLRAFRETNYFGVQLVSEILKLDSLIFFNLKSVCPELRTSPNPLNILHNIEDSTGFRIFHGI